VTLLQRQKEQAGSERQINSLKWLSYAIKIVLPPLLTFGLPFLIYNACAAYGLDILPILYSFIVIALVITAYLIVVEALAALRISKLPREPMIPYYPPASAIIAAYLPNEAAIIVETVEAMLRVDYPAPFQVILAYNTPRSLPIEGVLRDMAQRNPRLVLLRVQHSTSKAQNVNRALNEVTGAFVGIFDADHHPAPNAFTRAWHWLAQGYDVVQGHCVIRNGDRSWVARLVAVDFEVIYALSHPGRTQLHGFGIFGGANGYWRSDLLRRTGMHQSMLTEDIDASIRALQQGCKIVCDPLLISRELAPETLRALWNQRMRWAQGWFQVSLRHLLPTLRSPYLSLRQKLGVLHLLGWREVYTWLSVQVVPILAFQLLHGGVNWFMPLLVLSTVFTLSVGPLQVVLVYAVAAPEIQRHRWWFVFYAVLSLFFFTGFKDHIARIAHLKEALGEKEWKVTPRSEAQAMAEKVGV
jgi:cellulose synthase/poly-beta-1,6-N-acetylglucosamine synthase-like glycosyltransferase